MVKIFGRIIPNKDAVYVNYFGGFGGYLGYLQYFDRALAPKEVMSVCNEYKYRMNIHTKSLFERELNVMKVDFVKDKRNDKCNYLEYVKKKQDEIDYKNDLINTYTILCNNT